MRPFKIYSLSDFQVYKTVLLSVITTLYIRSPELTHLVTGSLYPSTTFTHSLPCPCPWQPPIYSFSKSQDFLDSRYKCYQTVSVFLCLIYFT